MTRYFLKQMTILPAIPAFVSDFAEGDSFATRDASLHSDDGLLDKGVRSG